MNGFCFIYFNNNIYKYQLKKRKKVSQELNQSNQCTNHKYIYINENLDNNSATNRTKKNNCDRSRIYCLKTNKILKKDCLFTKRDKTLKKMIFFPHKFVHLVFVFKKIKDFLYVCMCVLFVGSY